MTSSVTVPAQRDEVADIIARIDSAFSGPAHALVTVLGKMPFAWWYSVGATRVETQERVVEHYRARARGALS